ncbi:MAG: METTL5 family protein [Promethearchaeota archaeon]
MKITKKQCERILDQMVVFSPGKANLQLEQYCTDTKAAVELLFIAGFMNDDIQDKVIVDLGTGTGRLAIASIMFGAARSIGIEIDSHAIQIARSNVKMFGLEKWVELLNMDVRHVKNFLNVESTFFKREEVTVLMNPPFGVHRKGADVEFLNAAMSFPKSKCIYSFHLKNEKNRAFLRDHALKRGWVVESIRETRMCIPWLYKFHEKKKKLIDVDIYHYIPTGGANKKMVDC